MKLRLAKKLLLIERKGFQAAFMFVSAETFLSACALAERRYGLNRLIEMFENRIRREAG